MSIGAAEYSTQAAFGSAAIKRARILGHVGLNHTVADVTDLDCNVGAAAVFDVSPIYVPAGIPRVYTD